MAKFEKGQWVRRTSGRSFTTSSGRHEEGFVGQIKDIVAGGWDELTFTNGHRGIAEGYEPAAPAASNDNASAKPKFKVGDRVRALVSWGSIKVGNVYVVPHIDPYGEVWFTPDGAGGWIDYLSDDELELVPSTPAIVALIENGIAKPATKPKVHADQASATAEAERLALAYPGQQFGVFVLADSKIADEVITKTAVLRAA